MQKDKISLINDYLKRVKSANKELTKKELFKDLLNRLYSGDDEIEKIIDAISKGAETTIVNIPRKDKLHRGSADTLYNKVIIEFENDLKTSLKHAKEQLAGYLLGQFNSGGGYNYTLIVSDFIHWKVFSPEVTQLDRLDTLSEETLTLNEVQTASFTLTESNAEDFYFWLDRYLFKEEKQKATLKRIEEAFGYQSNIFIECFGEMLKHFNEIQASGEIQVSHEQWKKFLSIAYGSFDASENNFLIHTYLSVFSKMLAYTVVTNDDYIDDKEMLGIIDGSIFHKYNIRNFVDNDFFYWIKVEKSFKSLKKVFRLIAQELSTFDFYSVDEDILKGVYQELIDLDTRHSLGEYYTPDWLCERIVSEFNFKTGDKILDPACGSGSFLRAAIHRIRELNPHISIEQLNDNIYGIDIHPLSVQIAKTTVLLALGKEVTKSKTPIYLNIIQANTLLAPDGVRDLFGGNFEINIDREKYKLNTQIFEDVRLFDDGLEICDDLAEQTLNRKVETIESFENILYKRYKKGKPSQQIIESFYKIYQGLKVVKENGRDSIWKFILQNLYKPYFLSERFNYIIGNPPWFTYSSIKNEEYQDTLNLLAVRHFVKPEKQANFPHLEIAAIFLSYCSSYFLKENGKIAFVVPRSFFSADHHDNTRSGKAKGFRLTQVWDLDSVSPLFRIPSCVLFGEKAKRLKSGEEPNKLKELPASGLFGKTFKGKLPTHNCNLKIASSKLTESEEKWFYIRQGKSTAFSTRKIKSSSKSNPYKALFKQGATIVPRTFNFIELTQETPSDWDDRVINIKTSDAVKLDAKKPWKEFNLSGKVESSFIFLTALSKNILPFALHSPCLTVLPILIGSEGKITMCTADELMREGNLNASKWFKKTEALWNSNKTEKNKNISSVDYLNWQNKLTDQNLNAPYLVLYNASAKDANATIVKRSDFDLTFIVESVAYVYYTHELNEAYYLTAILNSKAPNELMKDFQPKGLFGARHVHKKILDIYYPKFDASEKLHIRLSELSETAHQITQKYLNDNPPKNELTAIQLGKLRVEIKKNLAGILGEMDQIVRKIIS